VDAGGVQVAHAIPGRIRLKIEGLRANPGLAQRLEERLSGTAGVRHVEASPVTGSLLIRYDEQSPEWRGGEVVLAGKLAGVAPGLDLRTTAHTWTAKGVDSSDPLALKSSHVTGLFGSLNEAVSSVTGGTDLKLLVPLLLVLLGVRGFLTAERMAVPRWYDFLWFGFGAFIMLNGTGVSASRAAEEAAEVVAALG
jgi:Heavy metal associated domain 2